VKSGIVVFGHGSSVASANDAVRIIAARAAAEGAWGLYETAFLEAAPLLEEAVQNLAAAGADEIVVLPYFLTLGIHLQRDLPAIVSRIAAACPNIQISVTAPLDGHPGLASVLADRARGVT